MQSLVVLINPFSIPKGREEEFLKMWNEVAQYMKDQPGFIDLKLHRSLDPDARFQFINIAHWQSAEAWQTAMSKVEPKVQELSQQLPFEVESSPALYRPEVEY
ncbi:antibiotic biosynthesis monooxygenase [Nostoc sp. CHAB 5824]|nr:antibiotic biosynthesis monooxygenase [Nostoc sp. CHAB 5824]